MSHDRPSRARRPKRQPAASRSGASELVQLAKGALASALGAGLLLSGCFTDASGRAPNTDQMYFPTGLTMSPGGSVLYVANSDFDLQYSAGWLHALDAGRLRRDASAIADGIAAGTNVTSVCNQAGLQTNAEPWLNPGPCSPYPLKPYIGNVRLIGAFASGSLFASRPDSVGGRLFLSVRGDPSITYFDVDDDRTLAEGAIPPFRLDCNSGEDGFCGEAFRLGRDPERTLRGIQLPADPVGIAADADGEAIVTAHQTQTAASLVHNDWVTTPELSYFVGNLSSGPTEIAALNQPAFVAQARATLPFFLYRPSFALTYRNSSALDIITYFNDSGAVPPRPFVVRSTTIPLNLLASSIDSRGVTVVDAGRRACEQSCETAAEPLQCQVSCAENVPLHIYVANRSPASLLIGRVETIVSRDGAGNPTSAFEDLFFFDAVPLNFGPARVETGQIVNKDGEHEARVFVTCFDSRTVYVFDPQLEQIESIIRTGRGPHDVASDAGFMDGDPYAYLYVGHFTDSYMGAIDLDMRRPATFGQVVANFGTPSPPKEER